MDGWMQPNYGLATILLAPDIPVHPMITHTWHIAHNRIWLLDNSQQMIYTHNMCNSYMYT